MTSSAPPPEVSIIVSNTESGRTYRGTMDGHDDEAVLELSRMSSKAFIAAHTGVPDSMQGQGVGMVLLRRLIDDARLQGFSIVPLCPFVKAQYRRHPEWSDVIRG